MDLEELRIHSYLSLGYFIDYSRRDPVMDFSRVDRALYSDRSEADLVRIGVEKLRESFRAQFELRREHVIPLSGGLDSRLILGALLELTEARNIHTVTFGVPGSYDYDIGCLVAKHAGTRHCALAIDGFSYQEDELLDRARRMHCQVIVFFCPPLWHLDRLFGKSVIWSGYVNDAVGGSHLSKHPSPTLLDAKHHYLENRRLIRAIRLDRAPADEYLPHIAGGELDPEILTYDEQVLFAEAVSKFTAPIVLLDGYEYKTPFINSPWMDFMFSAPTELRLRQKLMIQIAQHAFPKLFSLPTKTAWGFRLGTRPELMFVSRVINRAKKSAKRFVPSVGYPLTLYNDFDERFRDSPELIEIARRNLADLTRRGVVPWLDLDAIWKRHHDRRANLGYALIALVSLELVLKAAETKS